MSPGPLTHLLCVGSYLGRGPREKSVNQERICTSDPKKNVTRIEN